MILLWMTLANVLYPVFYFQDQSSLLEKDIRPKLEKLELSHFLCLIFDIVSLETRTPSGRKGQKVEKIYGRNITGRVNLEDVGHLEGLLFGIPEKSLIFTSLSFKGKKL